MAMEVTNLVHIMFQIWITDVFLNGHFISLGSIIIHGDLGMKIDPLETVFPKVSEIKIIDGYMNCSPSYW